MHDYSFYEEKEIDGKMWMRYAPNAPWIAWKHPIDKLLSHLQLMLNMPRRYDLVAMLGIQDASISRVRQNKLPLPLDWLVLMHDLSGLSIVELRQIARLEPALEQYFPVFVTGEISKL